MILSLLTAIGIDCTKAIDITKDNKIYFLWETHHGITSIMPKYQYDIISKFENYPPI